MQGLIPLGQWHAQSCGSSTEGRNSADQDDRIAFRFQNVLQITESAIVRRVAQRQIDDVLPQVKKLLQHQSGFPVFFFDALSVPYHRHVDRHKHLIPDLRNG